MIPLPASDRAPMWSARWAMKVRIGGAVCILLAIALIMVEQLGLVHASLRLDPRQISHNDQYSYAYSLHGLGPLLPGLRLQSDTMDHPYASNLRIYQDGVRFGAAHNLHARIARQGAGRYSHWSDTLYFSTPDNSDPRTNGHSYSITGYYSFSPWLVGILAILGLMAIAAPAGAEPGGGRRSGAGGLRGRPDIGYALALVALAALESWLLLNANGHPAIVASTDGGNISGWIAGRIYPSRFATDFLLSDPSNTAFYTSLFLTAIRILGRLTGDIGRAYLDLYFPIVGLQLVGSYFLGRMLTGSKLSSLILALLVNVPIQIWGYNEIFGTYFVPLTRTAYEAILPFLMMGFLALAGRSRNIPLLFVLCGLSFYIHPVSAPAASAGLLLASFALRPPEESFARRLAYLFGGGVIFLAVAAPFAISFLANFSGGLSETSRTMTPELSAALEVFQNSNGPMYYNALLALRMFLADISKSSLVWIIGFVTLLILPFVDPTKARICKFLLLFLAGCLMASVGICLLGQTIAAYYGRPPFQLDLIRGLRFAPLPLLLGFVLALTKAEEAVYRRWRSDVARPVVAIVAIAIVCAWWSIYPNRMGWVAGLAPIPEWARSSDAGASAMMRYLRSRPADGTVLPIGDAAVCLTRLEHRLQKYSVMSG